MNKIIEIPEGYEARIEGNKVVLEPKESEDEMMLREISRYIKEQGDKPSGLPNGTVCVADMLAWLEKQKEQNRERINITEMVAKYRVTDEYIEGEYKGKPVNCMIRAYEQGIRDTLLKVKEQKPAEWSEEDERILKGIIGLVDHDQHYGVSNKEMLAWLKSLRPQKKYEWDETDKKQLLQIIEDGVTRSLCKEGFRFHFEEEYAKDLIEYICSFNPSKSHWKPSEEQMIALSFVKDNYKDVPSAFNVTSFLIQLYDDLKKLM